MYDGAWQRGCTLRQRRGVPHLLVREAYVACAALLPRELVRIGRRADGRAHVASRSDRRNRSCRPLAGSSHRRRKQDPRATRPDCTGMSERPRTTYSRYGCRYVQNRTRDHERECVTVVRFCKVRSGPIRIIRFTCVNSYLYCEALCLARKRRIYPVNPTDRPTRPNTRHRERPTYF